MQNTIVTDYFYYPQVNKKPDLPFFSFNFNEFLIAILITFTILSVFLISMVLNLEEKVERNNTTPKQKPTLNPKVNDSLNDLLDIIVNKLKDNVQKF